MVRYDWLGVVRTHGQVQFYSRKQDQRKSIYVWSIAGEEERLSEARTLRLVEQSVLLVTTMGLTKLARWENRVTWVTFEGRSELTEGRDDFQTGEVFEWSQNGAATYFIRVRKPEWFDAEHSLEEVRAQDKGRDKQERLHSERLVWVGQVWVSESDPRKHAYVRPDA